MQSLYDVRATVPVQLTAKNGASLSVVHSTFSTLPWPGFYVYNVTRDSFNSLSSVSISLP